MGAILPGGVIGRIGGVVAGGVLGAVFGAVPGGVVDGVVPGGVVVGEGVLSAVGCVAGGFVVVVVGGGVDSFEQPTRSVRSANAAKVGSFLADIGLIIASERFDRVHAVEAGQGFVPGKATNEFRDSCNTPRNAFERDVGGERPGL